MNSENSVQVLDFVSKAVEEANGTADVMAFGEDNQVIFIINDAKAHFDYIKEWSENDVSKWFHFSASRIGSAYCCALVPNLEESGKRWEMCFQLQSGYPPDPKVERNYVFKPISFTILNSKYSEHIAKLMSLSDIEVSLVDSKYFDRDNLKKVESKELKLGKIKVNSIYSEYCSQQIQHCLSEQGKLNDNQA